MSLMLKQDGLINFKKNFSNKLISYVTITHAGLTTR